MNINVDVADMKAEAEVSMMNQITSLEEENRILKKQMTEKDSKISDLENLSSEQEAQMKDMKEQLFEMQNGMEEQEYDLRTEISVYTDKEKEREEQIAQLKELNKTLERKYKEASDKNQKLEQEILTTQPISPLFPSSLPQVAVSGDDGNIELEQVENEREILISDLTSKLQKQNEQIEIIETENENLKEAVNTMREKYVNLLADIETMKNEAESKPNEDVDERLSQAMENNATLERELKATKSELKKSSSFSKGSSVLQTWKQLEDLRKEQTDTKQQLQNWQNISTELEKDKKRLVKEHALAQAAMRTEIKTCKEEKIRENQALSKQHDTVVTELELKITELKEELKSMKESNQLSLLEESKKQDSKIIDQLQTKLSTLESSITDLERKLKDSESEKCLFKAKIEDLSTKDDEIAQLNNDLDTLSTKLRWLEAELSQEKIRSQLENEKLASEKQIIITDLSRNNDEKDMRIKILENDLEVTKVESAKTKINFQQNIDEASKARDDATKTVENLSIEIEQKKEEINLLRLEIKEQKSSLGEFRENYSVAKLELDKINKKHEENIETKDKSLYELESKVREKDLVIFGLKQSLDDQTKKIEKTRAEITALGEKSQNQLILIDDLEFQIKQNKFSSNQYEEKIEDFSKKNHRLIDETEKYRKKIESMEEELKNVEELSRQNQFLRKESEQYKTDIAHMEEEIKDLQDQSNNEDEKLNNMEIESLKNALEKREILIENLQSSLMSIKHKSNAKEDSQDDHLKNTIIEMKKAAQKKEKEFEQKLAKVEENKKSLVEDLSVKLKDRETTIAALVKASVTIEGKLEALEHKNVELKSQIENGDSTKDEQVIEKQKEITILKTQNDMFQNEINDLKLKIDQVQLENKKNIPDPFQTNKNHDISDSDSVSTLSWRQEREILVEENTKQLKEKDKKIAVLKKISIKQEQHLMSLENEIDDLRNDRDSDETKRLRKETEIFAGQVIEQENEIRKLTHLLKKAEATNKLRKLNGGSPKSQKSKRENADLVKKIEDLEFERKKQNQTLLATKKEIYDLKEKLKSSEIDGSNMIQLKDELDDLKNYVKECEHRMEDSTQYYLGTIEDLEQQLEMSREFKNSPNGTLLEGYKKDIIEKERLIASLERAIKLQGKKVESLLEELDELRKSIGKRPRIMRNNENLLNDIETERATNLSQANQILELKKKMNKLNEEISNKSKVSKEEIKQLTTDLANETSKNSKLVTEMTNLKEKMHALSEKEERSTTLSMEIEVIRSNLNMKTKLSNALETEVAQLKENIRDLQQDVNQRESNNAHSTSKLLLEIEKEKGINASLQSKLSDLQSQQNINLEKDKIIQKLESDVKIEKASNAQLKVTITSLKNKILPLEKENPHQLELNNAKSDVEIEKATNEALTKALSETRERANRLEDELNKYTSNEGMNQTINEQLTNEMKLVESEREKLQDDLEKANKRIAELERGARIILDLQSSITDKDVFDGKSQNEFDELIATLRLEKDGEIDSLRKNLVETQRLRSGVESELKSKLEESKKSLDDMREDYEKKMQRKNFKLATLEENFASQEQTMSYMRAEMDQLQNSMQKVVLEKRAESKCR